VNLLLPITSSTVPAPPLQPPTAAPQDRHLCRKMAWQRGDLPLSPPALAMTNQHPVAFRRPKPKSPKLHAANVHEQHRHRRCRSDSRCLSHQGYHQYHEHPRVDGAKGHAAWWHRYDRPREDHGAFGLTRASSVCECSEMVRSSAFTSPLDCEEGRRHGVCSE
jgi:hypothetical protein